MRSRDQNRVRSPEGPTSAGGLLAAPPQRGQTHAAPRTSQLVAGRAEKVNLVSDREHPSESAPVSRGGGPGAGSCGKTTSLADSSARSVQAGLCNNTRCH